MEKHSDIFIRLFFFSFKFNDDKLNGSDVEFKIGNSAILIAG